MNRKNMVNLIGILAILLIVMLPMASAEMYNVNPCAGEIRITEDKSNFFVDSSCFQMTFPKSYDVAFDFFDRYSSDNFNLKISMIIDEDDKSLLNKKETDFKSLVFNAYRSGNKIIYENSANKVRLIYSILNDRIEADFEIDDWSSAYATGKLKVRTEINKGDTASAHFISIAPEVDGKKQLLDVKEIIVGEDTYLEQVVFIGKSAGKIVLDPIYQVDYSPVPALWLINGSLRTDSDSSFSQQVNVTSGVSDSDDDTQYDTGLVYAMSPEDNMVLLFHMNNDSVVGENNTHVYDFSENGNNGTVKNVTWTSSGRAGGGYDFNGVSGSITIPFAQSLNFTGKDFTLELWTKTDNADYSGLLTNSIWVVWNNVGGWALRQENSGLVCAGLGANNSGAPINTCSTTNISDDEWHHIVAVYDRDANLTLYVDGVAESSADISSKQYGEINLDDYVKIGINAYYGEHIYDGIIDEVVIWNRTLTSGEVSEHYAGFINKTIVGSWNITYSPDYNWWLRVRKLAFDTANTMVYAYQNNDSINTGQYVEKVMLGQGWFNINVSSLMDYELNVAGLNYTKLRVFSELSHNFSEILLRKEADDNETPVITDCVIDNTNLTALQTARLSCNVTDNLDVDYVNGTIGGVVYNFTKNEDIYYYDWICFVSNDSVDWNLVNAVDIAGNHNSTNPNMTFSCNVTETQVNLTLDIYYSPYGSVGEQLIIYGIVKENGVIYPSANVSILLDNMIASMTWDNISQSYMVYWIPSAEGNYPFTVIAVGSGVVVEEGNITIAVPFNICISLWNNINMTYDSRYINEFAWIYAQRNIDYPSLSELFTSEDKYPCPPQSPKECHWHGQYVNGTACIDLYETGNYSFYLIGNRIQWRQDIGSGYWKDCDFCPPHAVQQRLLLNLGEYHLNGINETFDMFYSEYEIYYVGAFFGGMTSWLWAGLMVLIGVIFFFIILFATHSLKSAMAGLVLVPVIIQLVLMFGI